MGRNGGTLIPWARWLRTILAIGAIVAASSSIRISLSADPPEGAAENESALNEELTAEDLELLFELELLLDLELLQEWDPVEDLPIPLESPEVSPPDGENP